MSSPVEMECPNCAKALKVPPAVFGKKIKCRHCGHAFVVQDPAAAGKSGAKPAAPPPAVAAPAKHNPFADDEDEGPAKIEVIREDDTARCPHCAQELDPPDAVVCVHCGFNNVTRAHAETKKVYAPELMDWVSHLFPGVVALAIVIGLIVFNIISITSMREWLEGSFLEMDEKDAAGRKRYIVAPGAFIFLLLVISLPVFIPALKFAYRRLIKDPKPPEKVKT
jgi:ribosomal protein L37E